MAGHSKWAQIKHKKAKEDAKRGQVFNKLIREITVAARLGGGDPDLNHRLRLAIERAKAHNMPWENIERAIKRGTGEDQEAYKFETVYYEGYGPGGVAILVKALTDNKNRTVNEIRHIFNKHGGNLGTSGSVIWQFIEKGVIYVSKEGISEDEMLLHALEAGAEDIKVQKEAYEIWTDSKDFYKVKNEMEKRQLKILQADITLIPQNPVTLDKALAEKVLKLIDTLEEHDDVQAVYSNFDIPEDILESIAESR